MPLRAYKTEIAINNVQNTLLLQHLGCARWTFNWALTKKKEAFEAKSKLPNAIELHRELNQLKKTEYPWFYQSSKSAPQNALRDCDKAFTNFFTRCKKKVKGKKGFPKFKSKKNPKQSFRVDGAISIEEKSIKLPKIGKLNLKEADYLPSGAIPLSATISKHAGRWFVSIQIEEEIKQYPTNENIIGVDLGIKTIATCSDGTVYQNPKALKKNLKKLKRKQRQLSKKQKGSKKRERDKQILARLHYRISNIRKDCLHKITSELIAKNNVIVLEDLKVSNLLKNHCLALSLSDVGMFEFRRQIEYKAAWHGRTVVFAPTFFPSSKLDHKSGVVNPNLKLSDRTIFHEDGTSTDRDLNAALNLRNYYLNQSHTASSAGIYASGDGSSSNLATSSVSPSAKEEFNRKSKL